MGGFGIILIGHAGDWSLGGKVLAAVLCGLFLRHSLAYAGGVV